MTACSQCIYCRRSGAVFYCQAVKREKTFNPFTGKYDDGPATLIEEVNKGDCKLFKKRKHFWESYLDD